MDEVLCGMGRTGTFHAWEQAGVVPDIQPVAKALGAGFVSIAAILINQRVVDVLVDGTGAFAHGTTYQGHPVSCAVALEVQNIIEEEKLVDNVRAMDAVLGEELKKALSSHPNVGDIRGRGLLWAVSSVLFLQHTVTLTVCDRLNSFLTRRPKRFLILSEESVGKYTRWEWKSMGFRSCQEVGGLMVK
jgi:adenosylmethionine-8-amino-7-oxononanoate aminotransferase